MMHMHHFMLTKAQRHSILKAVEASKMFRLHDM